METWIGCGDDKLSREVAILLKKGWWLYVPLMKRPQGRYITLASKEENNNNNNYVQINAYAPNKE